MFGNYGSTEKRKRAFFSATLMWHLRNEMSKYVRDTRKTSSFSACSYVAASAFFSRIFFAMTVWLACVRRHHIPLYIRHIKQFGNRRYRGNLY
jgi:hypothetical protein